MATELNSNISHMFSQLDGFVSSKTVVGEPIITGDVTIIPLVDIHFGMGAGSAAPENGDEKPKKKGEKSLGGLGANITPSAVLVITNGAVQLVNIKHQDSINKLIDMIPSITSKIDLKNLFGKKKAKDEGGEDDIVEVG